MTTSSTLEFVLKAKDEASSALGNFANKAKDVSKTVSIMGGVGTGAMGLMIKSASDAEADMAKFDATLATMGETGKKARAGLIKASDATLKLGFDNEASANSMAKFFQRTGDETQAIKLNALAMDLSRAKGIDLESATKAINMALSGSPKLLKEYGIAVSDTATPLENIGLLQKEVGGQADAFSKTMKGQTEVLMQNFSEVKEAIGAQLLPVLTQLLTQLQPIITSFINWTQAHPELFKNIVLVVTAIAGFMAVAYPMVVVITTITTVVQTLGTALMFLTMNPIGLTIVAIGALIAYGIWLVKNWDNVVGGAQYLGEIVGGVFTSMKTTVGGVLDSISGAIQSVIDKVNGLIDAFNRLSVVQGAKSYMSNVAGGFGIVTSAVSDAFGGKKADGGVVRAGRPYLVGERGAEMFTPNATGRISPQTGGGNITVNINGGTYLSESVANDIGNMIVRRLQMVSKISA